jgi:hypothetical protein
VGRGVIRSRGAGLRVTVAWVISFLATRSPLISGKHLPGITNDARSDTGPITPLRFMWAAITFHVGPRYVSSGPPFPFDVGHDYAMWATITGETKNTAHFATESRPTSHRNQRPTSHRNQRPTSNGITGPLGPEYAYAGGSISRHLPINTHLISRMTMNAALYELPPLQTTGRGRRRKKGARLSSPLQMAQDPQSSWIKTTVYLYGRKVKVCYKSIDALWYSSAGSRLLRVVVVHDPSGRRRDDCFFSTDLTLKPTQILETFAQRWPLEVCFRFCRP